jgi:hypothetical protein
VHLCAHVAGIDDEHAHVGLLDREHRRDLLERGFRRAVTAPVVVGLDGRVGRDVQDGAVRGAQPWQHQLGERDRGDDVDVEDGAQHAGIDRVQGGEGAGAERAGVVHEEIEAAEPGDRGRELLAVGDLGDVTGERDHVGALGEAGRGVGEPVAAAGVDHEAPAPAGERLGQGPPQSLRRARDQGHPVHLLHHVRPLSPSR